MTGPATGLPYLDVGNVLSNVLVEVGDHPLLSHGFEVQLTAGAEVDRRQLVEEVSERLNAEGLLRAAKVLALVGSDVSPGPHLVSACGGRQIGPSILVHYDRHDRHAMPEGRRDLLKRQIADRILDVEYTV
eukprot:scaffold169053_cov42-Prasinocladus_malaysianus.AAC.1